MTVSGARRDSRFLPVHRIVVRLADEFPAVPALTLFRATGKARRAVEQAGTLHPDADTDPDEIERLAREELGRWRPAHPRAGEKQFPPRTGWRYGD